MKNRSSRSSKSSKSNHSNHIYIIPLYMKIFVLVIGVLLVTAVIILSCQPSSKTSQKVVLVEENYRRRRRTPEPTVNGGAFSCPKIASGKPLKASGWTYQGCFKENASTNLINQGVLEIDLDKNNNPARSCAEYLAANVPEANVLGIQQIYPLEKGVKPSKVHCYYATDPTYRQYATLGCETDVSTCNMYLPGRANLVYTRAYDPNKHRYTKNTAPGVVKSFLDPSTITP